jgi:WD40 repeat protein
MSGHIDTINACVCAYTQPIGVTASSDRTIRVWDLTKAVQICSMGCSSSVYSVDVSITDSTVCSGHQDGHLRFWSIKDHKVLKEIKDLHDDLITSVSYT